MRRFAAFRALVRKDLVLYFSNRRALVTSIVAPIAIAAFFGALAGGGHENAPIAIAFTDLDGSALSKAIGAGLHADAALAVRDAGEAAAAQAVRRGDVGAAVVLPAGFGRAAPAAMLGGAAKPAIDLHYDPSQRVVLAIVQGLLARHVMDAVGRTVVNDGGGSGASAGASAPAGSEAPAAAGGTVSAAAGDAFALPFETRARAATAARERPYNSYAHAFAGMGVQFILFMGIETGVGLLLARRLGLWKRLRAAPLSRALLLGSTLFSGAVIAVVLLAVIFAAAIAVFGVRIEGSVVGFAGVGVAFALLTSSFGLLVAALGKTPEATRGLAIFATLVMVMLGGAWVPSFLFPEWLQTASLVVPTRWAVDGFDAMTWRGLGLAAALAPIGVLLAFSAGFAALAIWRFDWEEPRA